MTLNRNEGERRQSSIFACQSFFRLAIAPICLTVTGSFISSTLFANQAVAQSVAPALDGVGTVVTTEGNRIDITGGTLSGDGANLFHSFSEFGLSEEQIGDFGATPDIQNILGRVTGGGASFIDGLLQISGGNANLFLINPAGVLFGPNAQLNLPSALTVTTATSVGFGENWFDSFGTNNYDLLTGMPDAFAFGLSEPGAIVNTGILELGQNQSLTLLGGTVINTGTLATSGGEVTIAAVPGENIVRVSHENQLLSLVFETIDTTTNVPGTIIPQEFTPLTLPWLLTGGEVPVDPGIVVEFDGTVRLIATDTVIPNESEIAISSGDLDVSGDIGGDVAVAGARVGLVDGLVDASGINGGGTVRIGGDYQGEGTVPNAVRTHVGPDSVINASALVMGDAGEVIVWSDRTTAFSGEIVAQGGEISGDGGFVEVSGLEGLAIEGSVDTTAANGNLGTLLLDPTNIEIVETGGTATSVEDVDNINDPNLGPGDSTTIDADLINTFGANVTLTASNDITVSAPINLTDSSLTIRADNDLNVNSDITVEQGNVNLIADNDNSGAGDFSLNETSTIRVNETGDIALLGDVITIDGAIEVAPDTDGSSLIRVRGNEIDIRSGKFRQLSDTSTLLRFDPLDPDRVIVVGTDTSVDRTGISIINTNAFDPNLAPDEVRIGFLPAEGINGDIQIGSGDDIQLENRFQALELFGRNITANNSIDVGDANLLLFAREIDFQDNIQIFSTGNASEIFLEPAGRDQDIQIGGVLDTGDDVLDITRSDLDAIDVESIENLSIGRRRRIQNGTGTITIPGGDTPFVWEGGLSIWANDAASTLPNPGKFRIEGDAEFGSLTVRTGDLEIGADVVINDNNGFRFFGESPIVIFDDTSLNYSESLTLSDELTFTGDASLTLSSVDDLTIASDITTDQGDINIIADSNGNGVGELILDDATITTSGDFLAVANDVELQGTTLIDTGSGNITFQPSDPASTIGIGDGAPGTFNLNTIELTTNLASSGTVTIGSPEFTGTGEVSLRTLSSLAGNTDYDFTVRGGDIQFLASDPFEPTILQLTDNKTAQFISTGTISDGNFLDIKVGGENGSVLLDAANGVGEFLVEVEVSASRIAARTRDSGDVELRLVDSDSFGITSVGGVDGIEAAENGDIRIGFFDDLGGQGAISIEQPIRTSGSGTIVIGKIDTTVTDLNSRVESENGSITFESPITLNSSTAEILTTSGDITFIDDVIGNQHLILTTENGNIRFDESVDIAGLNINANTAQLISPLVTDGTSVEIAASESITTGDIMTSTASGRGGDIFLSSPGPINTDNLISSGPLAGGNITVLSGTEIITEEINSSSSGGDAGDVLLDPPGDIQVTSINAQGGTNGSGGDVTAATGQFFRATGSFTDQNGINASISTAGTTGNGDITIFHDGGVRGVPFIVGDSFVNGTAAAITTGADNSIPPVRSFPGSYFQGDISIITTDGFTELEVDQPVAEPAEPLAPGTLVEQLVLQIESALTQDYVDYFGNGEVEIKDLAQIQNELVNIGYQTEGRTRPSLIYAFFLKPDVDGQDLMSRFEKAAQAITGSQQTPPSDLQWQFSSSDETNEYPVIEEFLPEEPTGGDQLALLLVTSQEKPILKTTNVTRNQVLPQARGLSVGIRQESQNRRWQDQARQLYQWLIDPLDEELTRRNINNLVFILDAELRSLPLAAISSEQPIEGEAEKGVLPLAALKDENDNFLVQRYSLGLMPSMSLTNTTYGNINEASPLLMGTEDFSVSNSLRNLPGAKLEIDLIQEIRPDSEVLLDENFTVDNLVDQSQQDFRIIHLATHAQFNPGLPGESFIQFWQGETLSLDQVREILNFGELALPIELIVFSACETAVGDREAELGFAGAAYQAGVKSVLASLERISDAGTVALMTQFYHELEDAPIKAEALRQAQLNMLQGKIYVEDARLFGQGLGPEGVSLQENNLSEQVGDLSHPYNWAWFTMVGSPW